VMWARKIVAGLRWRGRGRWSGQCLGLLRYRRAKGGSLTAMAASWRRVVVEKVKVAAAREVRIARRERVAQHKAVRVVRRRAPARRLVLNFPRIRPRIHPWGRWGRVGTGGRDWR